MYTDTIISHSVNLATPSSAAAWQNIVKTSPPAENKAPFSGIYQKLEAMHMPTPREIFKGVPSRIGRKTSQRTPDAPVRPPPPKSGIWRRLMSRHDRIRTRHL